MLEFESMKHDWWQLDAAPKDNLSSIKHIKVSIGENKLSITVEEKEKVQKVKNIITIIKMVISYQQTSKKTSRVLVTCAEYKKHN